MLLHLTGGSEPWPDIIKALALLLLSSGRCLQLYN